MPPDPDFCDAYWCGQVDYKTAWDLQNQLADQVAAGVRPQTVLLLEHPHTYTLGRRGSYNHLLWDQNECASRGISVFEVDRGGDITYHGPGQLVGYPLMRLAVPGWEGERLPQADFVGYIRRIEQVLIQCLATFGVSAHTREGLTGVWVYLAGEPDQPAKIASIGVKVDVRGITRHGFALNVNPDMSYWQGIVPCGLDGVRMTALAEFLDPCPSMEGVVQAALAAFAAVFQTSIQLQALPEGGSTDALAKN